MLLAPPGVYMEFTVGGAYVVFYPCQSLIKNFFKKGGMFPRRLQSKTVSWLIIPITTDLTPLYCNLYTIKSRI